MDSISHLKSEDHMELMMMMMQMDKLPTDFRGSNSDINLNLSSLELSGSSGYFSKFSDNSTMASPNSFPNSPPIKPFFDNISLTQPQEQTRLSPILSPSSNTRSKWRKTGDLSTIDAFAISMEKQNSMASMREMIFRIAAMQPIHIDPESVKPPKRRNVKISKDPQSVAARHRRERISERIRMLQRLVPGGTKMDTASMLDEAIHYVKFLKSQVQSLERAASNRPTPEIGFPVAMSSRVGGSSSYLPLAQAYQNPQNVHDHLHYGDA